MIHVRGEGIVVVEKLLICNSERLQRMKTKETVIKMAVFLVLLFGPTGCGQEEAVRDSADILQTEEQENLTERQENPVGEQEDPAKQQEDLAEQGDSSEAADSSDSIVVISPEGEKIEWAVYSEGVYCYRNVRNYASDEGGLYGYLSEDGREITPCIYSEASPFSEGLGCALLDGKYGYIGKDGETVLPFIYDQASPFREGVAYFSIGEQYGLIDREGNVILELTDCDSISSFREELAYFSVDGLYGYMDQSGKTVIESVYEDAGYFYGGLAVVMRGGFLGVIGKDGRKILPLEYEDVTLEEACITARKEGMFYFFDRDGREVSSGSWDEVSKGGDGKDVFYLYQNGKEGLADRTGRIIWEPIYERFTVIPGKELVIMQDENGKYGVLDYDGQIRVPFLYSDIYCVGNQGARYVPGAADGLYVTDAATGKKGYLSMEDFSVKIPAIYDSLSDFTEDRAVARLDGKEGIVRYDGTVEMPLEYDAISLFSDGSMAVKEKDTWELTDKNGDPLFAIVCDTVSEWGDGYRVSAEDNYSFYDRQGSEIVAHNDGCRLNYEGAVFEAVKDFENGGRYPEDRDAYEWAAHWIDEAEDDNPDEMLREAVEKSGNEMEKKAYPWTEETKENVIGLLRCPVAYYYYISEDYVAYYALGKVHFDEIEH
jgi:hypothetical protein